MAEIKYHMPHFIMGILFGIVLFIAFIFCYGLADDIRSAKETNKEILSILKNNTCNLPYGVQDKIEETYKNVVSFECETNQ